MATKTIFQSAAQNILADAVVTSDVPPLATGYSLTLFSSLRPDWNIKFGVTTVTITYTLSAPARGDILVVPKSNLITGFATLTNATGLSQALIFPALQGNGISRTLALDLSIGTPNPTTRTSNVWHLVIASNPANVTIGAAFAIYSPKTLFVGDAFLWGVGYTKKVGTLSAQNWQQSRFKLAGRTVERSLTLATLATDSDADALEAFFDGCYGDAVPGLLWLNPDTDPDGYFGYCPDTFTRTRTNPNINDIKFTFTELSKGIPLL